MKRSYKCLKESGRGEDLRYEIMRCRSNVQYRSVRVNDDKKSKDTKTRSVWAFVRKLKTREGVSVI